MMTILGIILLPILFAVYFVDRFLQVFLCWMQGPTIIEYFSDMSYIAWSVLRVFTLAIILLTINWLW